jgi:hypothetical protein
LVSGEGDGMKKGEIGIDFYSKYSESLLNTLCSLSNPRGITLRPFQFKSEELYNGNAYYITGISIFEHLEDKPLKKTYLNEDLPPVEEMTDNKGQTVISRVKRINFLFDQAVKNISQFITPGSETPAKTGTGMKRELTPETANQMFGGRVEPAEPTPPAAGIEVYDEDLPF